MADDKSIAIGNGGACDSIAILRRDSWCRKGSKMEEDDELGDGGELGEKLDEDRGSHVANFIEKNTETLKICYYEA